MLGTDATPKKPRLMMSRMEEDEDTRNFNFHRYRTINITMKHYFHCFLTLIQYYVFSKRHLLDL
jgi:hypothetical protein